MTRKKLLMLLVSVCLALVLAVPVVVACAGPAPTPEQPKVTTWRFACVQSASHPMIEEVTKGLEAITERTEGRLQFEYYYGGESGYVAKEYLYTLEQGLMDIMLVPISSSAFEYPWMGATTIPFMVPDFEVRRAMSDAVKPMFEEFCVEHEIVNLVFFPQQEPWLVLYSVRNIQSISDSKGMIVRVYDDNSAAMVELFGGVPAALQKSEVYPGMQKGTLDGAITGNTSAESWHFDEVCKYTMKLARQFYPEILGVSKIAWDKLPKDQQEIVRDVISEWEEDWWRWLNDPQVLGSAFDYMIAHDMTILELPPELDEKTMYAELRKLATERLFAEPDADKAKRALELLEGAIAKAGY